ncbi:MAG: hypothetical protein HDR14_01890 [Lachnospiraceae bacterium]|nr:hypothetical protein [Lachnospiraceae bacterium]
MKRKKQFILLGIIAVSLLAACGKKTEQAPTGQTQAEEAVDFNMVSEQTEYEGFTQEKITEKAVSREALFSGYAAALQDTYENFRLPDAVTISPTAIYKQVEIVQESGFTENAEEILRMFLGDELSEQLEFSDYSEMRNQATLVIDSDEEKVYCAVKDCGFVSVIKPSGYEIGFGGNLEIVDIVHVDRGEPLSQSYALMDGEESIGEAVAYIEEWMNQNWAIWEPDFTYRVKTVEVRRYGDNYIYDFDVEKLFKGIPLDDSFGGTGMAVVHGYLEVKYIGSTISIRMCNRNSIDVFTNGTGILRVQSTKEEEDGWLSLSDCTHMLEQLFSEYVIYEISDIEMQYVLCPDYDSVRELGSYSYNSPGLRVLAKPVWCFVMDVPEEKLLNEDGSFTAGYQKHYIDVDMRTGEVWLELE